MNRLLCFIGALLAAAYVACSAAVVAHSGNHLILKLVLIQYAFLLPAVACYFLATRMAAASLRPRIVWSVAVSYFIYALLVTFVAAEVLHKDEGLQYGDEVAYRFEAHVFRNGHLAAAAPSIMATNVDSNEFYFDHFIIHQDKWTGIFPPGWPVVLAFATAIRCDWLLNPLLGLWILWLTYHIAILAFDEHVAKLAVLLMVASPSFLINCVGFMSHPLGGALLSAATLLLFRGLQSRPMLNFVSMLLLIGYALLIRQWTAFCIGAVLGITALWSLRNERRQALSLIGIAALVGATAASVLLFYNHALTGSYWRTTYAVAENRNFSGNFNLSPISLLKGIVVVTRWSLMKTDFYSVPFLLLLGAYALLTETEHRRNAYILGALFTVLVIGYTVNPLSSASVVGERFYYESFFAITILGARGWYLLHTHWRLGHVWAIIVAIAAVCCFHYALAIRDVRLHATPHISIMQTIEGLRLADAVVYVEGDAASHFNENVADWQHAPVFYMMDPGPKRRAVIAAALKRQEWVVVRYNPTKHSAEIQQFHTQMRNAVQESFPH